MRTALLVALSFTTLAISQNAPAPAAKVVPTFTEHVAPIVFQSCTSCHRPGEAAPFPLLNYADTKKRGKMLQKVVTARYMPPWHPEPGHGEFKHPLRLSDADVATFDAWVKGGMPEGPADKLPKLPEYPEGWQLGEPDMIVRMLEPFDVPASGRDIYRNFVLPMGLPDDKYITAIEVRPSARSVLHHVLFFVDEERTGQTEEAKDSKPGFGGGGRMLLLPMVAGWAVGGRPEHLPEGLGIHLKKGADLMIQSHFHPSGKKEKEQTTFGIHFADQPPTRTLVSIQLPPLFGRFANLDIPAGDKDWLLADEFELPCDVDTIKVGGHAHMLCRSMRLSAELPDGKKEPLFLIKDWDFDWQNDYTYAAPVRLPKGSKLKAEIRYDNSKDNKDNPNKPPKRVQWGRETTDEMGSITLVVVPADEKDLGELQLAVRSRMIGRAAANVEERVDEQFERLDTDKDGKVSEKEVPEQYRRFFGFLDANGDGFLDKDEVKRMLGGGRRGGGAGGGRTGGGDEGGGKKGGKKG